MNKEESNKLLQLTEYTGLNCSTLLRKMILQEPIKQRKDLNFRDLRRSIDKIGNNINLICYQANRNRSISSDDIQQVRECLTQIRMIVETFKEIYG